MSRTIDDIAASLSRQLPTTRTLVGAGTTEGRLGLWVQAVLTERGEFQLVHNLGGGNRPTEREVHEQLHEMNQHLEALMGADPALAALVSEHQRALQVAVFSGHMDFVVAEWKPPGEIELLVELDP